MAALCEALLPHPIFGVTTKATAATAAKSTVVNGLVSHVHKVVAHGLEHRPLWLYDAHEAHHVAGIVQGNGVGILVGNLQAPLPEQLVVKLDGVDDGKGKGYPADDKIVFRPLGLGTIIGRFRNPHRSHGIFFFSVGHGLNRLWRLSIKFPETQRSQS